MKTIRMAANLIMVAVLACLNSCKGQNGDQKFKPDISIKVNKEFDKNNNVIRYDSSYSYSYSGPGSIGFDSLFSQHFRSFKDLEYPGYNFLKDDSIPRFFSNGVIDKNWFFKDDDYFNDLILKNLEDLKKQTQINKKNGQTEINKWY